MGLDHGECIFLAQTMAVLIGGEVRVLVESVAQFAVEAYDIAVERVGNAAQRMRGAENLRRAARVSAPQRQLGDAHTDPGRQQQIRHLRRQPQSRTQMLSRGRQIAGDDSQQSQPGPQQGVILRGGTEIRGGQPQLPRRLIETACVHELVNEFQPAPKITAGCPVRGRG